MKSITIYLNVKCNIDCDYCYVQKKSSFMDRQRFEKILRWFIGQEGQEKNINFLAGEPLLSADLLVGLKDFLRGIGANKRIVIHNIPTNGILLNKEMLMRLKEEGIKLDFSLDGLQFEHNRFRTKKKFLFDKILNNIEIYKKYYELPRIKCTVHPEMAKDLDKRIAEFLKKGFRDIQILPVCALPWNGEQVQAYRDSIDRITLFYFKYLKMGRDDIKIYPLKSDIQKVLNGEASDGAWSCQLGSEPVFMPDGMVYACTAVGHYNNPELMGKFCIGHIDTGVDIQKMQSLLNYKCQEEKNGCAQTIPNFCCRRILDTNTRGLASPEDIARAFEVDAVTFLSVSSGLAPVRHGS